MSDDLDRALRLHDLLAPWPGAIAPPGDSTTADEMERALRRVLHRAGLVGRPVTPGERPPLLPILEGVASARGVGASAVVEVLSRPALERGPCADRPACHLCPARVACLTGVARPRSIRDLPPELRPRERLLGDGPRSLAPAELLAVLLQKGVRGRSALDLAADLLASTDGLGGLAEATAGELRLVRGMGPARAAVVAAAIELGRRVLAPPVAPGMRFASGREVYVHYEPRMRHLKHEIFITLLLDGKNRLIREVQISEGSLTSSLVHPREVFRPAIREAAAAVIFVHNHPSGDPQPSQQDLDVTLRLKQTAVLLGIAALDHVIVGAEGYMSFAERGLL